MRFILFCICICMANSCTTPPSDPPNQNPPDELKPTFTYLPNTIFQEAAESYSLLVGTYTKKEGHVDGKGKGIYSLRRSQTKPDSVEVSCHEMVNPSYFAISKDEKFLYAVSELSPNDGPSGTISAFRIDPATKSLEFINEQSSLGYAPCHVAIDATSQMLFVTNYVRGIIAIYPIKPDGGLEVSHRNIQYYGSSVTDRQEASHPHSVTISPDNRFAVSADLGTDKLWLYHLDIDKRVANPTDFNEMDLPPGSGPRHFAFHPSMKYGYVINELNSTITLLDFDASKGQLLERKSISILPKGYEGTNLGADIHVHPSGQFLYASNRGHNSLAIVKIDESDGGNLEVIGHQSTEGDFPRNFLIGPEGKYLWVANQNSDNVVKFAIDQQTGLLEQVGSVTVPTPVCLKIVE